MPWATDLFRSLRLTLRAHRNPPVPTACALNTPALRALVAAFEPGRFRPPAPTTPASPGDIEALVCRPNWALIDAVEAHLPRRPTALDILYERSQAAKKDAIRGLTFLAALAVFLQLMT